MTRIYEAIQLAQQEKILVRSKQDVVISLPEVKSGGIPDNIVQLYNKVENILQEKRSKIIQFMSFTDRDGSQSIIYEFLKLASSVCNKKSLLISFNHKGIISKLFNDKYRFSFDQVLSDLTKFNDAIMRTENQNLYFGVFDGKSDTYNLDQERLTDFIGLLRDNFQYIVFDSIPLNRSKKSLLITNKMDGVIVVLESEKVKQQVVEEYVNTIKLNEGKIIGAVLSNRKYYIPSLIYKHI